ncbi:ParB/RepB/Spo0J family partition protein [Aquicella lusitana]|uniref:Probable chromosome-partitioning protein ParB n=2 Tax=Aquicella lusitana TaxID=254246 RepID=A0A370GDK7_9COXI|nr:ParB/RepB/Spo0J family partition protein [Aquicella lusitana]RDI40063.1 chromosome segregation DNA-binding protein [Aquicella lusitana]VVC72343.1 putative chromosome-partitioning protein ParB [Aquicella lusitana]
MVKKRGLGKSLDALLAYTGTEARVAQEPGAEAQWQEKLSQLPVDQIQRGKYQPRREMDPESLQELANSIRSQGIIQPLIVRPVGDKYEIIAGERRFRAAQLVGLNEVPVIIRVIPDEAAVAIALIENIQRENLNPVEEAIALQRLIEEFGMTHQQVAEAVGKSRTSVTNLLRLLALPDEVKKLIEQGMLEMGHARTLITLPAAIQLEAAQVIVARGLSVRETENLVRRLQSPSDTQKSKSMDPDIVHLQEKLSHQLKLRVAIHCNAKGKGKLVIHYRNLRELDNLLSQFQDT